MEMMNELDKMELDELSEIESIPEEERKEKFEIKDANGLNWALRKLKAIESKENEIKDLAKKEIEYIKDWETQKLKQFEWSKNLFESLIGVYAMKQRDADPTFKKAVTPRGSVAFRNQQPEYIYDNDEVIKSLENAGLDDLIRVKKEPKKADIKKSTVYHDGKLVDKETGVIIEGVKVIEREPKLVIKLNN